jgi:hypothetical protein
MWTIQNMPADQWFSHFAPAIYSQHLREPMALVNKFVWLKCRNFIGTNGLVRPPKKKAAREGGGAQRSASLAQTLRRCFRRRGLFGLGCLLFSFEIARPARPFFNFVGLFAHTSVFTSATYSDFVLALWKLGHGNSTSI